MEWLQSLLGNDNGLQLILITLGLAAVLILLFWIFRKIAGNPASRATRNRVPRLSVTDAAIVDDKRRLILVRRDNVEHLVLIGGPSDVVVETNVVRVQSPAPAKPALDTPPAESETASVKPSTLAVAGAATGIAAVALDATAETVKDTKQPIAEKTIAAKENIAEKAEELESSASANLDDTKAEVTVAVANPDDTKAEDAPAVESQSDAPELAAEKVEIGDAKAGEGGDDEMQRLLDELSKESKQPAE